MTENLSQSETRAYYIDAALTATEALRAVARAVEEEAASTRALVADEDSDCMSRDLRAARLEGLEFALRVLRVAERWEF